MTELGDSSQNEGDSDLLKLCHCLTSISLPLSNIDNIISRSSFASLPSWLSAPPRLVALVELMEDLVVLVIMEALALAMEVLGMEADMEVMELDTEVVMELDTDMDTTSMRSFLTTTTMLLLTATLVLVLIRREEFENFKLLRIPLLRLF